MCIPTTYDVKGFEDTNGAHSKDVQYNIQEENDKLTNNDTQYFT